MDKPLDRLKQKKAAAAQKAQDDGRAGMIVNAVQSSGKDSQNEVTTAIHDLMMATLVGKDPRMVEISKTLSELLTQLSESSDKLSKSNLNDLPKVQSQIVEALKAIPDTIAAADRSPDLIPHLQKIVQAVQGKNTTAQVNVAAPNLDPILKAIKDLKFPAPEKGEKVDLKPLQDKMQSVTDAINSLRFPVSNYVLPFKDINGRDAQVQLDASGNVPTSGGGSGGGGTQYVELVTTAPATGTVALGRYKSSPPTLTDGQLYAPQLDASGNLKVNIAAGSSSGQQYADGAARGTATGTLMMIDDGTNIQSAIGTSAGVLKIDLSATTANATAVKTDASATIQPVSGTVTANAGTNLNTSALALDATLASVIKAEDAPSADADKGIPALAVRKTTPANTSGTDGDYENLQISAGRLWTASAMSDGLGVNLNAAGPGFLKVTDVPRQSFYDSFDAAPDTVNMWTSTTGSSGVAASVTTGVLSMGTGTVANGYSKFTSIPTFKPVIPGWIVHSDAIIIPDAASPTANALRLWGAGTTPATPTFAAPITDGYFFELSGSVLSAVVYAGGTRTQIATGLTLATTYQRYIIEIRTDRTYFYIGTNDNNGLVATTNFQSPQAQILPKLFLAVGNSTPPGSNSQIQCTGAVVSDTGKNATLLADGTFPWRRATVSAAGALSVALAANQSVNVAQINGVTPLMGNGVTGTGSQRVTIASDNTAFPVNATLSAETTKVIGTVNQGTNPWVTSNATTSVVGNGAAATAQRVTLANDSTGILGTVGTVTTVTTLTGTTTLTPGTAAANLGKAEDAPHTTGDVGIFALGVRNDTLAALTNTDLDYNPIATDSNGTLHVVQKASTATTSNVAGSATSVTLLSANAARVGAQISNDSSALIYIKFGTTASTTSYTVVLAGAASAPFSYYEVPAGYTGRIDAIWASATGNARVTEVTP